MIQAECFKNGADNFVLCLTKLLNLLLREEYVPKQLEKGVIVPIPKGDKDKGLKDNYRVITLLPVISKVFEECIIKRVEKWAKDHNFINRQQGESQYTSCAQIVTKL